MKGKLLLSTLLIYFYSYSQQSTIRGVVSIFNSGTLTGKRQYVTNAQVEDDFNKAQPAVTNNNGEFKLIYVGVKENTSISFHITAPRLQVVNFDALAAVTGQLSIIKISMAHPDSIPEYRRRIYRIGKTEAEKNLENRVEKINKEITGLRINNLQNKQRIDQLVQHLTQLEDQKKNIEAQAQDLARKYSQVNLDDASFLFRDAFQLFQNGNLDSAQFLLRQAGLTSKVDSILLEAERINQGRKELDQRDSLKNVRKEEYGQALQLKADLHKTRLELDSVITCYELLTKLDPGNAVYYFDYAYFLAWINQQEKAINLYGKALTIYRNRSKNKSSINADVARTQNNLGILYFTQHKDYEALLAYLEALAIFKRLALINPMVYKSDLARTQYHLGILYTRQHEYKNAYQNLREALSIYKQLSNVDPELYELYVALSLDSFGTLCCFQENYEESQRSFQEAISIFDHWVKTDPQLYEPYIATTQNNLGVLYRLQHKYSQAFQAFQKALAIKDKLVKSNSTVYEPSVAKTQINLGDLYYDQYEFEKAEHAFSDALAIYKRLANVNPLAYEPELARVHTSLANLYSYQRLLDKATQAFEQALIIYRRLMLTNPEKYQIDFAKTQNDLGLLFSDQHKYEKAMEAFQEALLIYKKQANSNFLSYEYLLAGTLNNIGTIYLNNEEPEKAIGFFTEALNLYQHLARADNSIYGPFLAKTQNNLGVLYGQLREFEKSERSLLEALSINKRLNFLKPGAFETEIARTQNNLGILFLEKHEFDKAEESLIQSFEIYKKWVKDQPEAFIPQYLQTIYNLLELYNGVLDSLREKTFAKFGSFRFAEIKESITEVAKLNIEIRRMLTNYYVKSSYFLLFSRKFKEAESMAQNALVLDPFENRSKINLAHALLFQGNYDEALKLYKELKSSKKTENGRDSSRCLEDLKQLEKQGITNKDVNKIKIFLIE